MSTSNITDQPETIGSLFGIDIPGNAHLSIGVHRLTGKQIDTITGQALAAGLPVMVEENQGTRWTRIGGHPTQVTLFAPDGYHPGDALNHAVEEKLKTVKFLEVPAPAPKGNAAAMYEAVFGEADVLDYATGQGRR